MRETQVGSLGWEDPLEEEMATHSSILGWDIPWIEKPGLNKAGKASVCNAGDPCSISGLGRSPGEGNGNPPQYSCLEDPMDGEA